MERGNALGEYTFRYDRLLSLMEEDGRPVRLQFEIMGMDRKNYYRIKDTGHSSISTLVRIADFYDVSTDYLLGRTEERRINGQTAC